MLARVRVGRRSLSVMQYFKVAEIPAKFVFAQKKSSRRFARAVNMNRRRDDAADFHARFHRREKVVLKIIKIADQIVSVRLNRETARFQVGDAKIYADAFFRCFLASEFNPDCRIVNRRHLPAVFRQKNGVPTGAAGYVQNFSRL